MERPDHTQAALKAIIEAYEEYRKPLRLALEKRRILGTLLMALQDEVGYGQFERAIEKLPFSRRSAFHYMQVAKEQAELLPGPERSASCTSDESLIDDETCGKGAMDESEDDSAPRRSGLWGSAPQSVLEKLPGTERVMPKENYVLKLPQLVLGHLKHFADALADFSRCYNLPADEERLGERLKAVTEWSNRVVPAATLKPRKKPYPKRCNQCQHEFTMAMKEDYTWVPLDAANPEIYGHWELVGDVARYHKQSQAGLRTAHYKTCPKAKGNEPLRE